MASTSTESHQKIKPNTCYAEQYEALKAFKDEEAKLNEEHLDSVNKVKGKVLVEKAKIIAKMREVFKSIPSFWATALRNTSIFADIDDPDVADLIHHITDFEVVYEPDYPSAGKIFITFSENPYFNNPMLYREIYPERQGKRSTELKIKRSEILWKAGKEIYPVPVPEEDRDDPNCGSFIRWLQEDEILEIDLFIIQVFFPDCLSYYRDQVQEPDDVFTEDDEVYSSGEDVELNDYEEGESEADSRDGPEGGEPSAKRARDE